MSIYSVCNPNPVTALPSTSISDTARLMREHHVGSVVVVEPTDEGKKPIGIVTDRDLALETLPNVLHPERVAVEDIMMRHPVTADQEMGLFEAILLMKRHGIRRLPIVDSRGCLAGLVTADDLTRLLAAEMGALSEIVEKQIAHEKGAGALSARYY